MGGGGCAVLVHGGAINLRDQTNKQILPFLVSNGTIDIGRSCSATLHRLCPHIGTTMTLRNRVATVYDAYAAHVWRGVRGVAAMIAFCALVAEPALVGECDV